MPWMPAIPIAATRAGSAWPVIIGRWVVARRVIGGGRAIGLSVIAIVVGRRPCERPEWRGNDRRGSADNGARHAEGPEQRKRRAGRIVLRLRRGDRQSGERGGERGRNHNSADTHGGSPGFASARRRRRAQSEKPYSIPRERASAGGWGVMRGLVGSRR